MDAPGETPPDLLELLAELRGANTAVPTQFLLRVLPQFRSMVRKHLPPRSPLRLGLDSEDLLQEGLLQLVRQVDQFRGATWAEFLAFVHAILNQKTAQQARRQGVRQGELRSTAAVDSLPANQATPSVDAGAAEDRRRVQELVLGLAEPYRSTMRMRLEGLDNQTIAVRLGVADEVVRQRLSRAVKMVQERW